MMARLNPFLRPVLILAPGLVNIDDDYALDFWARELNVTASKLKAAVLAAGNGVEDVKRELRK